MRYNIVDNARRKELVRLVYGPHPITIRAACQRLDIKITTAKTILKIYRREGRTKKLTAKSEIVPESSDEEEAPGVVEECAGPPAAKYEKCNAKVGEVPSEQRKQPSKSSLEVKSMTGEELALYLEKQVAKFGHRAEQLSYIAKSYKLLDQLFSVFKHSESKILREQERFSQDTMPSVLNELSRRQGPLFAQASGLTLDPPTDATVQQALTPLRHPPHPEATKSAPQLPQCPMSALISYMHSQGPPPQ